MEERAPGPPFKARRPPVPPTPVGARALRTVTPARIRLGPAANDNPVPLPLKLKRLAWVALSALGAIASLLWLTS